MCILYECVCAHVTCSEWCSCVCKQCVCGQLALTGSRSSGQVQLSLCMWRGESVTSLLPPCLLTSSLLPPCLSWLCLSHFQLIPRQTKSYFKTLQINRACRASSMQAPTQSSSVNPNTPHCWLLIIKPGHSDCRSGKWARPIAAWDYTDQWVRNVRQSAFNFTAGLADELLN